MAALASALAAGVSPASAQDFNGFLRERGRGDVSLSYTAESYGDFWAGATKVSDPGLGEVRTLSFSLWAAYGLTGDLSLFASLPWVDAEGDGEAGLAENDLQDVMVLAAHRLARFGSSIRSELIGGLGLRTPASSYEANLPISVGDGTTDGLFRLVYLLRHDGFYLSQQIGYDLRGGDAPDGLPLYTEVGYTLGRTTINGSYAKLLADGGTDIGDPGFTFPGNQEEYERIGAKIYVRLGERAGVALSGFSTLDGRNTGDASGLSLGMNVSF